MTNETKIMAQVYILIVIFIVGFFIIIKIQDAKIRRLSLKLQTSKEYCIGKENRLDFCRDLMITMK